jgi:hypothetical protein
MLTDEELLLAVLNSAPVVDGHPTDALEGDHGRQLARSWGGVGSVDEAAQLRRARAALQAVIRGAGSEAVDELARVVVGAVRTPRVAEQFPGRVRACANTECNLFLIDHSRPGTAKWCSMATCGNRAKARTHARRPKIS